MKKKISMGWITITNLVISLFFLTLFQVLRLVDWWLYRKGKDSILP